MTHKIIKVDNYLLVLDDKDKDFYAYDYGLYKNYKLGLVTGRNDDVLEFEGECIDESNLSKIIAHLPLNGSPILEGVDLLPPYSRHQEDGVDDAVIRFKESWIKLGVTDFELSAFSEGYNKAREKYKYTEEDIRKALLIKHDGLDIEYVMNRINKYPTEFECEMIPCDLIQYSLEDNIEPDFKPKTITTAQGVQWVGKYK